MKKFIFWCLYPFIIVFVLLTLFLSYTIDILDDITGFIFQQIYDLENWVYYEDNEKKK